MQEWWKVLEARAMNSANPINPQRVFWELSSRLPDNCILSSDSGTSADWFARDIKIRKGMSASFQEIWQQCVRACLMQLLQNLLTRTGCRLH